MPSRRANPYCIQPHQRAADRAICAERAALERLEGKTVRLWDTAQGNLTPERYEIIVHASFTGTVTRIAMRTEKLRVKFGNGQHGHTCSLWLNRSQVDPTDDEAA